MKRLIILVLALAMLALTACGGNSDNGNNSIEYDDASNPTVSQEDNSGETAILGSDYEPDVFPGESVGFSGISEVGVATVHDTINFHMDAGQSMTIEQAGTADGEFSIGLVGSDGTKIPADEKLYKHGDSVTITVPVADVYQVYFIGHISNSDSAVEYGFFCSI